MVLHGLTLLLFVKSIITIESSSMEGDVIIGSLFDIWGSANGKCSNVINPVSVKYNEAIKWTLKQLNDQNYIPGVKLGFQTWYTCGLVSAANDKAIDIINEIRADKESTTNNLPPIVGLIGPEHSSQAENVSLLLSSLKPSDRLLQIGFSTTAASLANADIYKNFKRVVPSDRIQIEVMISLLIQLEWNYVVVIYDTDAYGVEGYNTFRTHARRQNICVKEAFPVPTSENDNLFPLLKGFLDKTVESSVSGVIVFSSSERVKVLLEAAQKLSTEKSDPISFLFSERMQLQKNIVDLDSGKGVFLTAPSMIIVDKFESYWKDIFENVSKLIEESETNDWLRDVFTFYSTEKCRPSNDSKNPECNDLEQSQINELNKHSLYTGYAIKAAYVLANVIKQIHIATCFSSEGICNDLRTILYGNKGYLTEKINELTFDFNNDVPFVSQNLGNIAFSFDMTNEVKNDSGYSVYQYRKCLTGNSFCFVEIGEYTNSILDLETSLIRDYHTSSHGNQWPNINRAQCPNGLPCDSCIVSNIADDAFFQDGDLIVCGVIPIHSSDINDPFKCGDIRTSFSVEIAEALAFAVKTLSKDLFPGKTLGFVFINSCNQALVVQNKLLELFKFGVLRNDGTYTPIAHKLLGCVGAFRSDTSIAISKILAPLGIIQIAYASTAAVLSDRKAFPYFMRTCTPDDKQAKAMMKIVQMLKSNFIQIIYSEGAYGEGGRDAIRKEAMLRQICLKHEIMVKEGDNFKIIIDELRKNSFAKIVIVILHSHTVPEVLEAITSQMNHGEFMFLGSEGWGVELFEFQSKHKLVGSITLSLQMAKNDNLTSYLRNLDVFSNNLNPWIKNYAEKKFDCYFSTSFDKSHGSPCDRNLRLATSDEFEQEIWTPFALNAMRALLSGSHDVFSELCGSSSTKLCDGYIRHPDTVWDRVSHQKLDLFGDGFPIRVFDDNGDGNGGYRIYNLQKSPEDATVLVYKQIGQSPLNESEFRFETDNLVTPDELKLPSVCPNEKTCLECFPEEATSSNTQDEKTILRKKESKTESTIVGVFVGIFGVIDSILIAVIIRSKYFKYQDEMDPYFDVTMTEPYLTPFQVVKGEDNPTMLADEQNTRSLPSIPKSGVFESVNL